MSDFIGCKISLISKAGIRYEGILYTIDAKESTVALSKVKSFGTEEREVERQIAARDEIYEYIIFRGSDIADLNVCESSKELTLLNDDSAIVRAETSANVSHGSIPNNENDSWLSKKRPSPKINPEGEHSQKYSSGGNKTSRYSNENKKVSKKQDNQGYNGEKYDRNYKKERYARNYEKYHGYYDYGYDGNYNFSGYRTANEYYYPSKNPPLGGRYKKSEYRRDQYYSNDLGNKLRGFESSETSNYREHQTYSNYYDYRPSKSYTEKTNYQNLKNKRRGNSNKNETKKEGFKEDYDFETANAIMAKELENLTLNQDKKDAKDGEDNEKEDGEISDTSDTPYYDKTKSFFDNISSEVTDRANGKTVRPMNRKEERKMNVETFGVAESSKNRMRSGGNRWNRGNGGGIRGVSVARRGQSYSGAVTGSRKDSSGGFMTSGSRGSNQLQSRRPVPVGGPGRGGDDY